MPKTVLLVEDDAFLRETIRVMLEEHGIEVTEAADGEDAVTALASHEPDLVILDLLMPRRDGYSVLHEIRERNMKVAVVILTNVNDYLNQEKCMKLGAKDYLIKSDVDQDELWAKIQKYL